jgi:ubiquinone/menaquinone biosynthesis C-methylase UbiE
MSPTTTEKAFKGAGMEGFTAKWYAKLTLKEMAEFKALARRVAAGLPPGARVLEVAPGPGYLAIELAKLGEFRIEGLDISRTFVEIAERNAQGAGVGVKFRQGNAAAMPYADGSFDYILCCAAFKNFAEPIRALNEMYRVLANGGRALIIDLRRDATQASIGQAVDSWHLGPVNTAITKLTFRFMLLKRAYTKAEFKSMLAQTKFEGIEIKESTPISYEVSMRRT